MKNKKTILLLFVVMMLVNGVHGYTYYGTSKIYRYDDERVNYILDEVELKTSKQTRELVDYFLNKSKYKVFNGSLIPYTNSSNELYAYFSDGKYTKRISESKGCMAYANFISQVIYGSDGNKYGALYLNDPIGKITAESLEKFMITNVQAGEHIRIDGVHSMVYLASDDDGFYFLSYAGNYVRAELYYTTYEHMAEITNSFKRRFLVFNVNSDTYVKEASAPDIADIKSVVVQNNQAHLAVRIRDENKIVGAELSLENEDGEVETVDYVIYDHNYDLNIIYDLDKYTNIHLKAYDSFNNYLDLDLTAYITLNSHHLILFSDHQLFEYLK